MANARQFGQAQGASPWSAGAPPGLQQQQQQTVPQQMMFNQPMGGFDLTAGAWQGQQPAAVAQQWAPMQQVQFVPNPAFMQHQPPPPQQQQQMQPRQQHHFQQQQQHQRQMQQRPLSASRVGANSLNKRPNQNNNFGNGGQQNWQPRQQYNNNNQYQQHRATRQQSRQNNQKGPNNNNNGNNNHHNNNLQNQQQGPKKGPVKVTKVAKKQALKAKQGNKAVASTTNGDKAVNVGLPNSNPAGNAAASSKPQSRTAERKQLKLQARKNAESLKLNKMPVQKASAAAKTQGVKTEDGAGESANTTTGDEPIDQAQLKCVPAVFGFVCKLCDVFLRDKVARREHIDSEDHMQMFKASQELHELTVSVKQEPTDDGSKITSDVGYSLDTSYEGDQNSDASEQKPNISELQLEQKFDESSEIKQEPIEASNQEARTVDE